MIATAEAAFYVTGGTLRPDARSYVERQADADLLAALRAGEYCYVLNSRQMGKSSLCVRTITRLQEEGTRTVFLDLTKFGSRNLTAEQWYAALLAELGRELGLRAECLAYWKEHPELPAVQRLFGAIAEVALKAGVRRQTSGVSPDGGTPVAAGVLPGPLGTDAWRLTPDACPLVIFVDEIDITRSLPFSTDEFFAAIRQCYVGRATEPALQGVTFCLLGTATPAELIEDTRVSPFNIGRRIEVRDFTPEEAAPLAWGLAAGSAGVSVLLANSSGVRSAELPLGDADQEVGATFEFASSTVSPVSDPESRDAAEQADRRPALPEPEAQRSLERILYWTGGHPYLTQRLCRAIAEARSVTPSPLPSHPLEGPPRPPKARAGTLPFTPSAEVDRTCAALFLTHTAKEGDDNLALVRTRLLKSEADLAALLELYGKVRSGQGVADDETNALCGVLKLSGVAKVEGGRLRLRNRIYERVFDREWVTAHMPDAELQRQRAAYRRGLLRASAIAGVVVAVMLGLTTWAVRNRRAAERNALRADRSAVEARQQALRADQNAAAAVEQGREARRQQRLAEARAESGRRDLYARSMSVAMQALDEGNQGRARDLVEQQRPGRGQMDLRGWEWRYLWQRCRPDSFLTLPEPTPPDAGVAFSPDGRTLALVGKDRTVRLWKLARSPDPRRPITLQGKPALLTGCNDLIRVVAFSPDGKVLAAAGFEKAVRLWDVTTRRAIGDPLPLSDGGVSVPGLAFSANGRLLVARDGSSIIRFWDRSRRWRALAPIRVEGGQTDPGLALSPDGKFLAYTVGKTVQLRRLADGYERTLQGHSGEILGVAFSPDGRTVATGSADETLGLWDVATARMRVSLKGHRAPIIPVAFARDGRTVASGSWDATLRLWDVSTLRARATLMGHGAPVTQIALSPDGKTLASTSLDGTARLWNTAPRPAADVLPGQERMLAVCFVAFSGDGRRLATGAQDGIARLWDLGTDRRPRTFQVDPERGGMIQVALSPDGETLVAGRVAPNSAGGGVRAWQVATGAEIFRLEPGLVAMAFSPDGRHLALTTSHDRGRTVELWDIRRNCRVGRLADGSEWTYPLAFSPDGRTLAGGSASGSMRLWDVEGRRLLATLRGHTALFFCLAFSHDGRTLASGSFDGAVRLWDVAGHREQGPPLQLQGAPAWGLAFSRDDRTLAMTNQTRGVLLWNVETRQQVATLNGHELQALAVAFSPDGSTLATGATDQTVRLWRAPPFAVTDARDGAPPRVAALTERRSR